MVYQTTSKNIAHVNRTSKNFVVLTTKEKSSFDQNAKRDARDTARDAILSDFL